MFGFGVAFHTNSRKETKIMGSTIEQRAAGFGVGYKDGIDRAIEVLRLWEKKALDCNPENGYYGAFSGGKDSVVIKELAKMAGVKVRWHYNVTTIDPPEIYRFIREYHPDVVWNRPPKNFFDVLADDRGYPTRLVRWCCDVFKHKASVGKTAILGVRWAESARRLNSWKQFQKWGKGDDEGYVVNPIVDWSDANVWRFILDEGLPYCCLYDEGFKRLGCVGCPMSGRKGVAKGFARWPQYERAWRRAFHRLWDRRLGTVITRGGRKGRPWPGLGPTIANADQLFDWWKSHESAPVTDKETCSMGLW